MADKLQTIATMSREILYEDGSGPRAKVSFDSSYRLGKDDESYVFIQGVGEGAQFPLRDVQFLIEALQEAVRLDGLTRSSAKQER